MKIEKLTENKIRVIVEFDDLQKSNSTIESIMSTSFEEQKLFLYILNKAEKELNFNTDGCKLLIEAFSSIDDIIVFTITKFSEKDKLSHRKIKIKRPIARKKADIINTNNYIYSFENFDTFCDFCLYIYNLNSINITHLAKNIRLYLYKDIYYLVLKDKYNDKDIKYFERNISEFAKALNYTPQFISKLSEHGNLILKHNALKTARKFL